MNPFLPPLSCFHFATVDNVSTTGKMGKMKQVAKKCQWGIFHIHTHTHRYREVCVYVGVSMGIRFLYITPPSLCGQKSPTNNDNKNIMSEAMLNREDSVKIQQQQQSQIKTQTHQQKHQPTTTDRPTDNCFRNYYRWYLLEKGQIGNWELALSQSRKGNS